jgi:hypothetical protein
MLCLKTLPWFEKAQQRVLRNSLKNVEDAGERVARLEKS